MEDLTNVPVREQVKALILTSTQSKQKLEMMTSMLDTQAATTAQIVTHIPLIATITQPTDNQEMAEQNPFKILKVKVSSPTTSTINLDDSYSEEDVIASAHVTEEVDQHFQSFTYLLNSDGKKCFIPVSIV